MSVLVGVTPETCSHSAVRLGALLARSYREELVLVCVVPAAWPPRRHDARGERREELEEDRQLLARARAALEAAARLVPGDLRARTAVREGASVRRGLLEACHEFDAVRLVLSSAGGKRRGRIRIGSMTHGLLHSAHLPVALAPLGYEVPPGARLTRVTAAYNGSETAEDLILGAAAVAARAQAGLRIASFAPLPRGVATAGVGAGAEAGVIAQWEATVREHATRLLGDIEQLTARPASLEVAVGAGEDWEAAMLGIDWHPAEVLLVGPSGLGPLARVSLGSHAPKLVRNSPVPVVLVPRHATAAYAAQTGPGAPPHP